MRNKLFSLLTFMMVFAALGSAVPSYAKPAQLTGSDLRSLLYSQLSEHTVLAASATNAALGGRTPEFEAAAASLDANSVDLSKSIGAVYGAEAEKAFLPLWRSHIGFFVDYTKATAGKDKAAQDKAVNDLVQYTQDFGAFLSSANPNLPKDAVADLVKTHVLTLKDVVDAQAAGDQAKAFTALRKAIGHMDMIASPLSGAIVKQFPDKITGNADSAESQLRKTLNVGLREHTWLAASATNAALGGRTPEFEAAAGALDANSVDLSKAIGSVYGAEAEKAFLPLWRSHIGFFVDYTKASAGKDKAAQDKAVNDLVKYSEDFGAFLSSANPNLPKNVVADLIKTHVLTLKDVVDAQAAGDQAKGFTALRTAAAHMSMIADPLTGAIVKQFPDKFGAPAAGAPAAGAPAAGAPAAGAPGTLPNTGGAGAPSTMPNTGAADSTPWGALAIGLMVAMVAAGSMLVRRSRAA